MNEWMNEWTNLGNKLKQSFLEKYLQIGQKDKGLSIILNKKWQRNRTIDIKIM